MKTYFQNKKKIVQVFLKVGVYPQTKEMSLKLLVFVGFQLVMIASHPFFIRNPVLNFRISQKIEKCLIPSLFFIYFFTLVEHMLKLRVLIVPGVYSEHLPTLELGL